MGCAAANRRHRPEKEALYARAGGMASVHASEVGNVRHRVAQGLEDAGTVVDKELTPAASRMQDELQRLATLQIPSQGGWCPCCRYCCRGARRRQRAGN
jgi:hypothetical protein